MSLPYALYFVDVYMNRFWASFVAQSQYATKNCSTIIVVALYIEITSHVCIHAILCIISFVLASETKQEWKFSPSFLSDWRDCKDLYLIFHLQQFIVINKVIGSLKKSLEFVLTLVISSNLSRYYDEWCNATSVCAVIFCFLLQFKHGK